MNIVQNMLYNIVNKNGPQEYFLWILKVKYFNPFFFFIESFGLTWLDSDGPINSQSVFRPEGLCYLNTLLAYQYRHELKGMRSALILLQ